MSASENLHPKQFRKLTAEEKTAKREKVLNRHSELAPMKETIRNQGASFASVSGHLRAHSKILFGTHMSKADTFAWAVRKHKEDPENFLKNIGFTK
jgi:hypothetical protein